MRTRYWQTFPTELGAKFNCSRFIPYVQYARIRSPLVQRPEVARGRAGVARLLVVQTIRKQFQSPEEINDSEQTSLSKQIMELNPGYAKVTDGVLISQKIGLEAMRVAMPSLQWLDRRSWRY